MNSFKSLAAIIEKENFFMIRSKLSYGIVISKRHNMLTFMEVPWDRWYIVTSEDIKGESAVMGEDLKNKRRNIKRIK